MSELEKRIKETEQLLKEMKEAKQKEDRDRGFNEFTPCKQDILNILDKSGEEEYKEYFGLSYCMGRDEFGWEEATLKFGDGWKIDCIYRHGGDQGDGEEHYLIIKVTQHDANETYWKVPGWYQSYAGGELEFDDMFQVEPYQKTVTDYKRV